MVARTARYLKEGGCYYVQSQSYGHQKIFKMSLDFERYVQLLKKYKLKFRARIYAYCLMPTAAHLIVHPENSYILPLFMQGINQSYALFFKNRYNGTGKVWGQRYKSTLVNGDEDFFARIKSIEFIPVQECRSLSPVEYPWSSCTDRVQGLSGIVDHLSLPCFPMEFKQNLCYTSKKDGDQ